MIDTKKAYLEKMQGKLKEWQADIDKLKAKATQAKADLKIELANAISEAEKRCHDLEGKMQEIDQAEENTWEKLKGGVQSAWDQVEGTFKNLADKFK